MMDMPDALLNTHKRNERMALSVTEHPVDSSTMLDLKDIGVLRFTVDAVVSKPERYAVALKRARQRSTSSALESAFVALEREFQQAPQLDRDTLKQIGVRMVGDVPLQLAKPLPPVPMAGYSLLWSLGERRLSR